MIDRSDWVEIWLPIVLRAPTEDERRMGSTNKEIEVVHPDEVPNMDAGGGIPRDMDPESPTYGLPLGERALVRVPPEDVPRIDAHLRRLGYRVSREHGVEPSEDERMTVNVLRAQSRGMEAVREVLRGRRGAASDDAVARALHQAARRHMDPRDALTVAVEHNVADRVVTNGDTQRRTAQARR